MKMRSRLLLPWLLAACSGAATGEEGVPQPAPGQSLPPPSRGKGYIQRSSEGAADKHSIPSHYKSKWRDMVLVIDPGHGGKDPGAAGPGGILEKNVVLAIGQYLKQIVDAETGFRAVMTRSKDEFVPLRQRTQIAQQHNADLLISIHTNWYTRPYVKGAAVYVLSERGANTEAARWSERRENNAEFSPVPEGSRADVLGNVLMDLSQGATLQGSLDLAKRTVKEIKKIGPAYKDQVERANFVVLRTLDVPSILIETGFVSNPTEAANLNSSTYQRKLARAIFWAAKSYAFEHAPPNTWIAQRGQITRSNDKVSAAAPKKNPLQLARIQEDGVTP